MSLKEFVLILNLIFSISSTDLYLLNAYNALEVMVGTLHIMFHFNLITAFRNMYYLFYRCNMEAQRIEVTSQGFIEMVELLVHTHLWNSKAHILPSTKI